MIRRIIAIAGAILATVVLVPTAVITRTYIVRPRQVDSLGDWFQVLLPVVPPVIALLSVVLLWRVEKRGPVGRGAVWGAFVSCTAYMAHQAWILSTQFTIISRDGTTHWAMLYLPAVWLAWPLLLTAMGISAFIGWIARSRLPNQAIEATSQ